MRSIRVRVNRSPYINVVERRAFRSRLAAWWWVQRWLLRHPFGVAYTTDGSIPFALTHGNV